MKSKILFIIAFFLLIPVFAESYYTGNGRNDLKIQVESPELNNIGSETAWLPEFIVNTISDDIAKYSAITVVDTYNAKRIADTQRRDEGANFSEAETVEAGNFAVAKNVLLVSITGKSTSYALSVRINDKEKNVSLAAYSNPNCSFEALESGKAIKEAVADLLVQLNVELTESGKKSLLAVETTAGKTSIAAQKLVAQGTIAKQNGNNIEALSYFIQASTSDDTLERAIKAAAESSQSIAAGDFGTHARNLIQRRNDFKELIKNASEAFRKNYPYYIVYDPDVQMGKINYEKETFDIKVKVSCVKDMKKEKIYRDILTAYDNEVDSKNWGLSNEVRDIFPSANLNLTLQLSDNSAEVLGNTEKNIRVTNSLSDFYSSGEYTITISANADTSNLILSVPKIVSIEQNKKNEIALSTLTINDYMDKVFIKAIEPEEVITGVSVWTLPNVDARYGYNYFTKFFNYGTVQDIAAKLFPNMKSYKRNELMYHTKEEDSILYNVSNYDKTKSGAWAFQGNCFYLNDNDPGYPRDKTEYLKNAGLYLPIEWVKLPNCEYLYAANTEELDYAIRVLGYGLSSNNYSYYESYSDVSFISILAGQTDSRNKRISTNALCVRKELGEIIAQTTYPRSYVIPTSNYDHTTSEGTQIGSTNHALRDFVAAIEKNPDMNNKLLALAVRDPVIGILEDLPKMQTFTDKNDISKSSVSKQLKGEIIIGQYFYELNYNLDELDAQSVLLCNALNELLGYKPFLLDENGGYAHSMEAIISRNYDTDGYMIPRDEDFSKAPSSIRKKIDKELKKSNNVIYLMKAKEETQK